jgi:hypothetical protein
LTFSRLVAVALRGQTALMLAAVVVVVVVFKQQPSI